MPETPRPAVRSKSPSTAYPGDFLQNWSDLYGNTFVVHILFDPQIFTTEPEFVKAILATEFNNYWKGPDATRLGRSLLGFGVFNADDEMCGSLCRL
ncbi:hypothetical protein MVEN_01692700 [Mycena venus]|uniref:Uncharacterized protein n=1 Tax=Mycena venus TaxID=2733690 RepID=A0A8H6XPA1_9AGAR|nr:hypothetical protein MVEN_01692700 [Mycena venus]